MAAAAMHCSTTISLKKPNKKQPMSDGIPHSGGGASKEDEEPEKPKTPANDSEKDEKRKTPANDSEENEKRKTPARDDSNGDPPLRQQLQKSGVGSSRVVDQPRIRADDPPLCDGIPHSGGGASKEDEEPKIRPVVELQQSRRGAVVERRTRPDDPSLCDDSKKDEEPKTPADDHRHGDPPLRDDSKKDKKPKTPANDSEKDEKPEKPKTPANDSEENEKPKTPARDDSNGDPPLRQAELPLNELLVLLAVYAVLLALLPVETLKSNPGTKATTVTVLYAFAFSVVIWLKLQQPRITKGYTLISICQFLMIRLVFTGGFVCIACIVSVFIPDGLGWIVIYVSVNGTVSCILVAWDIASMFRAAVRAETLNP